MLGFILKFFLTTIVFSIPTFMALSRFNRRAHWSDKELLLYALGAAPALVALFLYYSLLVLPGQSDTVYLLTVCGHFVVLGLLGWSARGKVISTWSRSIRWVLRSIVPSLGGKGWNRAGVEHFASSGTPVVAVLLALFVIGLYLVVVNPIIGSDYLQYGSQGKVFYLTKAINYQPFRYHETSGFFFEGLHGFTVPLSRTWELILNNMLGSTNDLYFKSLTAYYCLLLILLVATWTRRVNALLSNFTVFALVLSYGFLILAHNFHIDALRIFLFSGAIVGALRWVNNADTMALICFGVFGGLAANVHSLGVMLIGLAAVTAFFFMDGNVLKERFPKLLLAGALFLFFGAIHYVLDVFWGTGWIFQEIKFY